MKFAAKFLVLPILALSSACASMGGLHKEPLDLGKTRVFDAPLAETNDAVREAMIGAQLMIDEIEMVNDSTWLFLSKKGAGIFSWGEMVRVVTVGREDETEVRVISRRKGSLNVTAKGDYSDDLFTQIDFTLRDFKASAAAAKDAADIPNEEAGRKDN